MDFYMKYTKYYMEILMMTLVLIEYFYGEEVYSAKEYYSEYSELIDGTYVLSVSVENEKITSISFGDRFATLYMS